VITWRLSRKLGERFQDTVIREVKEETNLDVRYEGELKSVSESKEMRFFDLDNLPKNLNDRDLIKAYVKFLKK